MKVNRLLGDKLAYELEIRGYPTGENVAEKRFLLCDALRLEPTGNKSFPLASPLEPNYDLNICEKLKANDYSL